MPGRSTGTFVDRPRTPVSTCYSVTTRPSTKIQDITILTTDATGPPVWPTRRAGVHVDVDDGVRDNWSKSLGQFLGAYLKRQGDTTVIDPEYCRLPEFPEHYELKEHRNGDRSDVYLRGSKFVTQFRSPPEFALHARWLVEGQPKKANNQPDCLCKYCSKTSQRDITNALFGRNLQAQSGEASLDAPVGVSTDDGAAADAMTTSEAVQSPQADYLGPRSHHAPPQPQPRLSNPDGTVIFDPVMERRGLPSGLNNQPRTIHTTAAGGIYSQTYRR